MTKPLTVKEAGKGKYFARLTLAQMPDEQHLKKELYNWLLHVTDSVKTATGSDYSKPTRFTLYYPDQHASRLGANGGKARAKNLSPERRKEIATEASMVAKAKRDKQKTV